MRGAGRRARTEDREWIADLGATAARVVLQIPWNQIESPCRSTGDDRTVYYVAQGDDRLICACGIVIGPPDVAHIRFFALDDDWPVCSGLAALMPEMLMGLVDRRVSTLAFIGVEKWFVDGLLAVGFDRVNAVVAMQKIDFGVPYRGNSEVSVRPVVPADYDRIAAIERQAFAPLWQSSVAMLSEYADTHSYFCVAEQSGVVVGYAFAYLQGRHGHLTRLAVHPDAQGKGIGSRLLSDVIAFMHRRRVFGITLNTQRDNLHSRRLYTWFGFTPLGRDADVLVRMLPV